MKTFRGVDIVCIGACRVYEAFNEHQQAEATVREYLLRYRTDHSPLDPVLADLARRFSVTHRHPENGADWSAGSDGRSEAGVPAPFHPLGWNVDQELASRQL